jgi:Dullard-like phosphatase family protein
MLSNNNVYSNININNYNNNEFIINHNSSVEKIIYNTNIIIKNLNIILEHFKSNSNESLLILFKKISQKNYEDINYYYRTFLLREENINGSFLASLYLKDNPNFHSVKEPYIRQPNNKRFTLILDLEETLLNFRLKSENKGEGILKLRPGLFEFLDAVQIFYEIILFTASSQDYAENLIDSIEEKKKYFEYKFFRQHNIIIENDFVKDLSRIGRDLDKMIIVDNMPQNYRLQKKNGINIKGFWGEELNDRILFNLKDILIRIAKEGGDLRIGLEKYHEDIAEKVTSSIYQFNFE